MNRFNKIRQTLTKSWDDVFLRNRSLTGAGAALEAEVMKSVYEKSDLVYICITTTARAISQVPLNVQRWAKNAWVNVEEDDPFQMLLNKPNPILNKFSFIEAICSYLMLDGDVYIYGYPPSTGVPASLYVVPLKYIEPIQDRKTNQIIAWRYRPSASNTFVLEDKDVSRIFFFNPYNPIKGFAPISAGKLSIITDYKAARFNQNFFDQGAMVGGTLSTDQTLNPKVRERIETEIDKKYTGYEKSWRIMLLEQNLKFMPTAPTHKDMMFKELRNLDKERILQIFGMKKSIISVTDDLNYATAKDQRRAWWHDTNLPIMRMICAAFNHTFFEPRGLRVEFDLQTIEALQEDFKDKVDTAKKLYEMGFTANEISEKLEMGFDPKAWRDYAWIGTNLRPVNEKTDLDAPPAGAPEEGPDEEPDEDDEPDAPEDEPEEEPAEEPEDDEEQESMKSMNFETRGTIAWKGIAKKAAPIEKRFESKVRKAFFEYRQRILVWLYDQGKKQKADSNPFVLTRDRGDIDELASKPFKKLKEEADALYFESMMSGLETLSLEIGEALDIELIRNPEAVAYLQQKVIRLVGPNGIQKTMSKQINNELSRGLEKGETLNQIADRIRRKFTFASSRAKTIARTETYGAMNYARNLGMKASPFEREIWYTSLDERVRPTHQAMHGQTKKVNEKWVVGGASLEYPGDSSGPAGEVINCRCITVPAL